MSWRLIQCQACGDVWRSRLDEQHPCSSCQAPAEQQHRQAELNRYDGLFPSLDPRQSVPR